MTIDIIVRVEGQRYALPLSKVNRVVRAVEVTPVPTAPDIFMGVIDVGGDVMPVVDLRLRLRLERRPVDVGDCMVVARQASDRRLVLPVDAVLGIANDLAAPVDAGGTPLHPDCIDRLLCDADGLILELDLDALITADQYAALSALPADHAAT
ncbi:MAG: chemotaxis protein CheW [Actinomycetes bacterium]